MGFEIGIVASCGDPIVLDYLPAYAPALKPVRHIWGELKQRKIANLCAANLGQIGSQLHTATNCKHAG